MLFVARESDKKILFRVDAWASDCTEQAEAYIKENGCEVINDEITMMGDMIIWVK